MRARAPIRENRQAPHSRRGFAMRRWPAIPVLLAFASLLPAQDPGAKLPAFDAKHNGSEKMHMLAHVVAHPGAWKAADIELEQDRDRPVRLPLRLRQLRRRRSTTSATRRRRRRSSSGRSRIPSCIAASARWTASTSRSANKYYYAQSFQFMQGSPDADLGAVIFDVTGLPDREQGEGRRAHPVSAVARRLPQHVRLQALRRPRALLRDDQSVEGAHLRSRRRS